MKDKQIKTKYLLMLYPLVLVIAKVIRWTIMQPTLINYSKGWGYVDNILNDDFNFKIFGIKNILSMSSDAWSNTVAVMQVVRKLFFNIPNTFIGFEVAITILWSLVLFLILIRLKEQVSVFQALFILFSYGILNIYNFVITKEAVQIIYFVVIFFILISEKLDLKQKYILVFVILLISIFTFRVYYIMLVFFAVAFLIIMKINKKNSLLFLFVGMCFAYFMFLLALLIISDNYYSTFIFEMLDADANEHEANTYIHNLVANTDTTNIFIITLEYLLVVIRLSFPVELIFLGVKYIPYVIYQIISSLLIIKSFRKNNDKTVKIAVMIYVAFLFMSASFEVDFGTWLRHQTVILPVQLVAIDTINNRGWWIFEKNSCKK